MIGISGGVAIVILIFTIGMAISLWTERHTKGPSSLNHYGSENIWEPPVCTCDDPEHPGTGSGYCPIHYESPPSSPKPFGGCDENGIATGGMNDHDGY